LAGSLIRPLSSRLLPGAGRRSIALLACLGLAALTACSAAFGLLHRAPAEVAPAAAKARVAVFLGDSYTVGFGGGGYVTRTAQELGWTAVARGQSGTGYVNPSEVTGQSVYGDRVAELVAVHPGIVVVQGSTNDLGRPIGAIAIAARELYAQLARTLPDAKLVVLGPLAPPGVAQKDIGLIRDVLADAAHDAGLAFIDPIAQGWLQPPSGLFVDGVHPNDAGYAELADHLVAALRALGI
jgi:lysophospholipase L1-like esterase